MQRTVDRTRSVNLAEVATIEGLLDDGARCLDRHGGWRDQERGREVYDQLRNRKPRIFNPALVRRVLTGERQTQLVYLAIKLGVFGSEKKLAEIHYTPGARSLSWDRF